LVLGGGLMLRISARKPSLSAAFDGPYTVVKRKDKPDYLSVIMAEMEKERT
jgi:hypothetical protein